MYNHAEYEALIKKISKRYRHAKITIIVNNVKTNTIETIINNAINKLDVYLITFDPEQTLNLHEYSDSYYCANFSDLKTVLFFILKNKRVYITKITNDYMDSDDMNSYDSLIEQNKIEDFVD